MDRRLSRSARMRRTLVGIYARSFGLAAVMVTALVTASASGAGQAQSQLRANQVAARRDAQEMLARLQLPLSAVSSPSTIPGFARSFLSGSSPISRYYARASRWQMTDERPKAVIAYVERHRPAGSALDLGSGTSSDTKTGVSSINIQFSWPDVPGRLVNRHLTVTVVAPRHGHSVVVADSESAWFVPRPATESVPAGVHAIAITVRLGPPATGPVVRPGGKVHTSTHVIWRSASVAALLKTFNGLPITQPSLQPLSCPMMLTGSSASELTLAFRTGRHGTTLARAQVFIHRGRRWEDGGGPCDPISFEIGGRQQTALTSPTFVKQVGRLVGADIS